MFLCKVLTLRSVEQWSVWNQRFQELVSLPDSDTKFHKLGCLAHDFEHAAETYGKIIIR